jgi:hypothetical protein
MNINHPRLFGCTNRAWFTCNPCLQLVVVVRDPAAKLFLPLLHWHTSISQRRQYTHPWRRSAPDTNIHYSPGSFAHHKNTRAFFSASMRSTFHPMHLCGRSLFILSYIYIYGLSALPNVWAVGIALTDRVVALDRLYASSSSTRTSGL